MPKPRAIARNSDQNPNIYGRTIMDGKHGYAMPAKKSKPMNMSYSVKGMSNSIRTKNLARMGKNTKHKGNPY